jgi:hypothetical protein
MNTLIRPAVLTLLFTIATVESFGQTSTKSLGARGVIRNGEVDTVPSASIRDVVSDLRRFHIDSDSDWEVPPTVSRNLELLKHGLRDMIIRTLATPNAAAMEPSALAAQVIDQLAREDVPVGDSGGYGVISRIEFHRSAEYPSWLVATTTLSIPYGDDTSLYLFELKNGTWKHMLTQESNGYKNISEAQGWLTYQVAPPPPGKDPYLITANVSPSPASVWQALRLKVLRVGADPDHPKLLAKRTLSYDIDDAYYFSVRANGFGLIYLGDAIDPDLAGYRGVHYLEYGVSSTRAWIERETAVDPYDIIQKWAAQEWTAARQPVNSTESDLHEWHRRLRKDHWECGLSGLSLSHRLVDGTAQLLSVANCTEGQEQKTSAFAVLEADHDGFHIMSFSTTKPNLPEMEWEETYLAGIKGLTDPVPVSTPQPKWPSDLPGSTGNVKLRILLTVDEHGQVSDVSLLDWPKQRIVMPAIQAVRKWKYIPGRMNGKPVNVQIKTEVSFEN